MKLLEFKLALNSAATTGGSTLINNRDAPLLDRLLITTPLLDTEIDRYTYGISERFKPDVSDVKTTKLKLKLTDTVIIADSKHETSELDNIIWRGVTLK